MPVLRSRGPGAWRGTNLRTRNTGSVSSNHLPETLWSKHLEGWHFEEADDTTREGIKGRDLADVNSSVVQVTGKLDNAAYIDGGGSTQELRCTTNDFRIGGDFTLSFWINRRDTWGAVNQPIMRYVDATTNNDWDFYSNNNFYFRIWDSVAGSQAQYVENDWTTNSWQFLVFTYDSTTKIMRSVLDNDTINARSTSALTNGLRQGGTRLRLGDSGGGATDLYWYIDEMHFFTEKKSDDWIEQHYNAGAGRAYPD